MGVRPPWRLRIVGRFHEIDEGSTTMAEGPRMTAAQVADKLLASGMLMCCARAWPGWSPS
jgi:hypothetical protein